MSRGSSASSARLSHKAGENPKDDDHTKFWLVLAYHFSKRGIDSTYVRDKSLGMINRSTDLSMLTELGMSAADLGKRGNL